MAHAFAPVRLLLVDDHKILLDGMTAMIRKNLDCEILGQALSGEEALAQVERLQPNLVLMDINLPGINGLEATKRILQRWPHIKVIMVSMHEERQIIAQSFQVGAKGYLMKTCPMEEFRLAIQAVQQGNCYLTPSLTGLMLGGHLPPPDQVKDRLSPKEVEVLRLVTSGHSNKDTALQLGVSEKTVENRRLALMKKLGLNNLALLTKYAIRQGIIELDP